MSRVAFMFMVLKAMYDEETLNVNELLSSSNPYKAGGPASLLYTFVPTAQISYEHSLLLGNFAFNGLSSTSVAFFSNFIGAISPFSTSFI